MFKHVLAVIAGCAQDETVFRTARLAVHPQAGHLSVLHVKPDVMHALMSMTAAGDGFGGAGLQELVDDLEADAARHEEAARAGFAAFCTKEGIAPGAAGGTEQGIRAGLVVETGTEEQVVAEQGRYADLIVVGRVRDDQEAVIGVLEAALMDTGRPLLIAPPTPPENLLGTVVIAWKNTVEAARAVAVAMPLIDRAERVVILSAAEGDEDAPESARRLQAALRWHVPATTVEMLDDKGAPAAGLLLDAARRVGGTLLVMGGYSHARIREVVFGGVTKQVLAAADIPVLMAH